MIIFRSVRHQTPLWKSSSLPLLFHGIEQKVLHIAGGATIEEMNETIRGISVQLRREEKGFSLVRS